MSPARWGWRLARACALLAICLYLFAHTPHTIHSPPAVPVGANRAVQPPPRPPPLPPPPPPTPTPGAGRPRRADTAIVTFDTRLAPGRSTAESTWLEVALAINLQYASRHGYDFLLYYLEPPAPWFRGRAAAWARVPAIEHALRLGYASVAWLDSDAIFFPPSDWRPLSALRSTRWPAADGANGTAAVAQSVRVLPAAELRSPRLAAISLWNAPYHTRPKEARALRPSHTGFLLFFARSPFTAELLRRWWARAPTRYLRGRDWDQGGWNELLLHDAEAKRHVAILALHCMQPAPPGTPQLLLHLTGKRVPKKEKAWSTLWSTLRAALDVGRGGGRGRHDDASCLLHPPRLSRPPAELEAVRAHSLSCLWANGTAAAASHCHAAGLDPARRFEAFALVS